MFEYFRDQLYVKKYFRKLNPVLENKNSSSKYLRLLAYTCIFFFLFFFLQKIMQHDADDVEGTRKSGGGVAPKEFVIPRSVAALTVIRRRQSVPRLTSDYAPRARLDDDGDDDEFMTMIISGGVPLRCHRCLSFRRGDSGVKKKKEEKTAGRR